MRDVEAAAAMRCGGRQRARRAPQPLLLPLLVPLLAAAALLPALAAANEAGACEVLMREFQDFNKKVAVPYGGDNMVYFLHVPRTAGRTFHTCLLKQGTPPRERCPKSYDHLRIDFTLPDCKLLSSHDDFSVVQQLPPGAAVVTQMREPLDRFLSAYEFAIEVAARQVSRPRPKDLNLKTARTMTDQVWPWSHLVPFFVDDINARIEAAKAKPPGAEGVWVEYRTVEGRPYYYNKALNVSKWEIDEAQQQRLVGQLDPYNNDLVMPLAEFVAHPIAAELLHNGGAYQVLGLTNYSHWEKAAQLRDCAKHNPKIADDLLAYAKNRLRTFSHVGTTDQLGPSVESCAASLGMPLDGAAYSNTGENRRAATDNPNRALKYDDAMARGDAPREVPAWRRLRDEEEGRAEAGAAQGQQQQQQQQQQGQQKQGQQQQKRKHPQGQPHLPDHPEAGAGQQQGQQASSHRHLMQQAGEGGAQQQQDEQQQGEQQQGEQGQHDGAYYDDGDKDDGEKDGGGARAAVNSAPSGGDVHSLAGDVRAAERRLEAVSARWNEAVEASAPQEQLRALRTELTRARGEVAAAQVGVVGFRPRPPARPPA
ncbi:MAG: hypothetical protein J3K34DRAFT_138880 [Monoraphidium minutum]|nr:MAG: hypothetical protein J3K34DRAFT_138880 [Monoraphidium minutum]